jgi:hypothetical protein
LAVGRFHAAAAKVFALFSEDRDHKVYLEADVDPVNVL